MPQYLSVVYLTMLSVTQTIVSNNWKTVSKEFVSGLEVIEGRSRNSLVRTKKKHENFVRTVCPGLDSN
jgi:hypothetical protein